METQYQCIRCGGVYDAGCHLGGSPCCGVAGEAVSEPAPPRGSPRPASVVEMVCHGMDLGRYFPPGDIEAALRQGGIPPHAPYDDWRDVVSRALPLLPQGEEHQ